jgi:hypothetical protein
MAGLEPAIHLLRAKRMEARRMSTMAGHRKSYTPREGAIIFPRPDRQARHASHRVPQSAAEWAASLARLIAKDGLDAKLFVSSDEITADCASKQARNVNDLCGTRLSGSAESCLIGPPIII